MQISNVNSAPNPGMPQSDPSARADRAPAEVVKSAIKAVETTTRDAVQAASPAAQANRTRDPAEIRQAVEKVNKTVSMISSNLQFTIDDETQMSVVRVVDVKTKDVIRQFPSEEVLSIAKALDHLQGLLVRDKA